MKKLLNYIKKNPNTLLGIVGLLFILITFIPPEYFGILFLKTDIGIDCPTCIGIFILPFILFLKPSLLISGSIMYGVSISIFITNFLNKGKNRDEININTMLLFLLNLFILAILIKTIFLGSNGISFQGTGVFVVFTISGIVTLSLLMSLISGKK